MSLLVADICSVKKKNDILFCKTIPCLLSLAKLTVHYLRKKMLYKIFCNLVGKVEQMIAIDCVSNRYAYVKCKFWYQEYLLSSPKYFHLANFRLTGLYSVEQAQP